MQQFPMKVIATIQSDFDQKFGIPKQSGMVQQLRATIVFQPEYRNADALRGLEGFSHIWLVWQFSKAQRSDWSPTVRPPVLGGNTRMGVFATRSPFRPNAIGLSCVQLDGIQHTQQYGTVLHVLGADLLNGTPIFDIKPYLPYADCRPEATGGFSAEAGIKKLAVECPQPLLSVVPQEKQAALLGVLACDPRPSYQNAPQRVYGFAFAGFEIQFTVCGDTLTVTQILPAQG